jgi:RNA polymerase sigma factor (sigma-70 family)
MYVEAVDETDLTDLFERYHLAVYRYFFRLTNRREDAEDLTQDLFCRVSRGREPYRSQGKGQETAWLFRIARHLLIDKRRDAAKFPVADVDADGIARDGTQLIAFGLQEALGLVNGLDRHVFVLREVTGLTYAEIADVCDITEDGVRARLFRVRGQLRELLGGRLRLGACYDGRKDRRR